MFVLLILFIYIFYRFEAETGNAVGNTLFGEQIAKYAKCVIQNTCDNMCDKQVVLSQKNSVLY